jgi:hypothetical protein
MKAKDRIQEPESRRKEIFLKNNYCLNKNSLSTCGRGPG